MYKIVKYRLYRLYHSKERCKPLDSLYKECRKMIFFRNQFEFRIEITIFGNFCLFFRLISSEPERPLSCSSSSA